ncbi:hypothetical protein PENVUL_c013G01435 [Penicillium vulpinum]|nr:hypothetical protein PENVUL_c013G01435 [Penicillium vulpinum]
MDDCANG